METPSSPAIFFPFSLLSFKKFLFTEMHFCNIITFMAQTYTRV